MESPRTYFEALHDPRIKRRQLHDFQDVIMLVLCGVIAGCDEWTTIQEYATTKLAFLKTFLKLPNGIPSHDTFGDIVAKMDLAKFEECFLAWTLGVSQLTQGEIISIDGKKLRGSYDNSPSFYGNLVTKQKGVVVLDSSPSLTTNAYARASPY